MQIRQPGLSKTKFVSQTKLCALDHFLLVVLYMKSALMTRRFLKRGPKGRFSGDKGTVLLSPPEGGDRRTVPLSPENRPLSPPPLAPLPIFSILPFPFCCVIILTIFEGTERMNVIHMKYAVEVARAGSINKASELLLVAQPNVSRSIKELEADLGITIFSRTSKGMVLTPEGEEFMGYAKTILRQLDEIEAMYKTGIPAKQTFSVSVPRASYIADAFARFSNCIGKDSAEIYYHETNSSRAIKNILEHNYNLGIIRYASHFDSYFKSLLDEKGLQYELVAEFKYVLIMNENHPLAQKREIRYRDLEPFIEISHADPYVPSLPAATVLKEEHAVNCSRNIYVFERGGQFNLLARNPETFMWVSPLPDELISGLGLVQKECPENDKLYRDMLIHRKDYRLSRLDKEFVTELCNSKRKYLQPASKRS